MRRSNSFIMIAAVVAASLAGCADPKAANKDNFKKAIQAQVDAENGRPVCVNLATYSGSMDRQEGTLTVARDTTPTTIEQGEALVQAGLMVREDTQVERLTPALRLSGAKDMTGAYRYKASELGKKYLSDPPKSRFVSSRGLHFCTGKTVVKAVTVFTEPADMMGHKVSQVKYTVDVVDAADWTNNPKLRKAFPELLRQLDTKPMEREALLVLTNEGWVDQSRL